jgi:ubiquinone/menaquinone biosynthesis C-methylase UbiE
MEFWDSEYESGNYLNRWDYSEPSQELAACIAAGMIRNGGKCLDLGCGSGTETIFISACGYRATGIDISSKALEIARAKAVGLNLKINWVHGDFLYSGLDSSSFDFISDRGCFHHITERKKYADEVYRLLKPGGKLLVRGCRDNDGDEIFVLVTADEIDKYFDKKRFRRGPVTPIKLISDAGSLNSNIIVITKT